MLPPGRPVMRKRITAILLCFLLPVMSGCGAAASSSSGEASGDTSAETETVEKPDYDPLEYVVLGEYLGLEIEATLYSATEEDYESTIENILSSYAYYAQSDKTEVEDGDIVNIDYVGSIDGEEFDGGSSEGYELSIGSGTFIDDFEEQLIGASVGDTVSVEVTFPDDYSAEEVAGEDAVFSVTINYICEDETTTPEYTDAFVEEVTDGEYTTTEEYDAYVWSYLEEQAAENTQTALDSAIQEAVYAACEVTGIPDGLTDYYVTIYYNQDVSYAELVGLEFDEYISLVYGCESDEEYLAYWEEQVTENLIPYYLIQEAIIEDAGLTVTDEGIESFMLDYVDYYGYDDLDSLLAAMSCETTEDFIELVGEDSFNEAVLSNMVWDLIEEEAVITYVEDAYSDSDDS